MTLAGAPPARPPRLGSVCSPAALAYSENNTIKIADVPPTGVTVQRGVTNDGLGKYYRLTIEESDAEPVDIVQTLKDAKVDVLVSYLPVGSEVADKYYAQCAIGAGMALVDALPIFIASDASTGWGAGWPPGPASTWTSSTSGSASSLRAAPTPSWVEWQRTLLEHMNQQYLTLLRQPRAARSGRRRAAPRSCCGTATPLGSRQRPGEEQIAELHAEHASHQPS